MLAALARDGLRVFGPALRDKEAFRALFALGVSFMTSNRRAVAGVAAAHDLLTAYTREVMMVLKGFDLL